MSSAAVILAGVAVALAVTGITAFAVIVIGVQLAEHRRNLPGASRGHADAFARWVLDVPAPRPAGTAASTTTPRSHSAPPAQNGSTR
jgi:hypothetical protein